VVQNTLRHERKPIASPAPSPDQASAPLERSSRITSCVVLASSDCSSCAFFRSSSSSSGPCAGRSPPVSPKVRSVPARDGFQNPRRNLFRAAFDLAMDRPVPAVAPKAVGVLADTFPPSRRSEMRREFTAALWVILVGEGRAVP
jgi:hypothetical protein